MLLAKLGYFTIISSVFSSGIILALALCLTDGRLREAGLRYSFFISVAANIFSFSLLVYAFTISDFSLELVLFNSSTIKPLIYKIAGSWASHEGSFLLLLACISFVSVSFYLLVTRSASSISDEFISYYALVSFMLASYLVALANPFKLSSLAIAGFETKEGIGLNPILQDIALSIHPPILYLGHAFCFILLAISLIRSSADLVIYERFYLILKTSSKLAWLFLTAGIALGSWWAYRELGWGGYWFFDPVENISLMPWLLVSALQHSLLMRASRGNSMYHWQFWLGCASFLSVIIGNFLVRSGLLTSVHAFAADNTRGLYLLGIFAILFLYVTYKYVSSFRALREEVSSIAGKPKYYLYVGNILWVLLFTIILAATIAPIIYPYLFSNQQITIDTSFFYISFVPVAVVIVFLTAYYGFKTALKEKLFLTLLAVAITNYVLPSEASWSLFFAFIAGGALGATAIYGTICKFYQRRYLSPGALASFLSHFGIAILTMAIVINTHYQKEIDFRAKVGSSIEVIGYKVSTKNILYSDGGNYFRKIVELWLEDQKGAITILKPELRFYKIENQLITDSNIYSYLTHDLYAVISEVENDNIRVTLYVRPAINFIWLACILICGGLFVSLICRRKNAH